VGGTLGSQYLKLKALYEALGGYEVGRLTRRWLYGLRVIRFYKVTC